MHLPTALGSAGMVFAVFWIGRLIFGRDEKGEQATPWRGLLIGGVAAGADGGFHRPNDSGTYRIQQDHPHALASHPMSGTALVGMERTQMAVGRAGGGMRGDIALHLYGGPLCAYTFSRIRTEFSVSSWCCRLGESPGPRFPWVATFVGAAALVAAPLLIYFALHPEHFFLHSKHLWVFDPVLSQGDPFGSFSDQCVGSSCGTGRSGRPGLAEQLRWVGQC